MNILRTFFVLLLCAMLPMSGLAASGLTGQCPMQAGMAEDGGKMPSVEMPDCDAMQSTASPDTARHPLCKAMSQCQMGSLYHPVSAPVTQRPAGLVSPVVFHYAQSLVVHTPDGPWRPPRSL